MKTLTKQELAEIEKDLRKRYKNVVAGSLTNCQTRGTYKNKRLVKVKCPRCSKISTTTTQELHHLRCECGELTVAKKGAK